MVFYLCSWQYSTCAVGGVLLVQLAVFNLCSWRCSACVVGSILLVQLAVFCLCSWRCFTCVVGSVIQVQELSPVLYILSLRVIRVCCPLILLFLMGDIAYEVGRMQTRHSVACTI